MNPTTLRSPRPSDEPDITQEESVPNDGRDVEGEALMKAVENKKLEDTSDPEAKTPDKAA